MDLKQLGYYIWMDEQEKEEEKRKQEERELLEYYKYLHRIQKEDEEEQITVFGKCVYIFTSGRCRSGAGESKNIYTLHNWKSCGRPSAAQTRSIMQLQPYYEYI